MLTQHRQTELIRINITRRRSLQHHRVAGSKAAAAAATHVVRVTVVLVVVVVLENKRDRERDRVSVSETNGWLLSCSMQL